MHCQGHIQKVVGREFLQPALSIIDSHLAGVHWTISAIPIYFI